MNPMTGKSQITYEIGQYAHRSGKVGYTVQKFADGLPSIGHDGLTFPELVGYLKGVLEYPRDLADVRIKNGHYRLPVDGVGESKPVTKLRLTLLRRRLHVPIE